jgi:hypothetical protein
VRTDFIRKKNRLLAELEALIEMLHGFYKSQ